MFESVSFHQMLLNDPRRMGEYRRAIHSAVRPGDVVLDIGSGSGILALFACQAGASRVYAVEREDIILVARKLSAANGFADRITFIQGDVTKVKLPEKVDVITSELISKAMLGQRMSTTIGICRDRHLKPGGRIVPQDVSLIIAPVASVKINDRRGVPNPADYDLDFSVVRSFAVNCSLSAKVPPEEVLVDGQVAFTYDAITSPPNDKLQANLRFVASRSGSLNGFCAWFSSRLWQDVVIDNAPPGMDSWDNLCFPLAQTNQIEPGTVIDLNLAGLDTANGVIWNWGTTIWQNAASPGTPIAKLSQSTFLGQPMHPKRLRCKSADHVATLNEEALIDRRALQLMADGRSLKEVAATLCEEFPSHYSSQADALPHVQFLSTKYSKLAA